MTERQVRSTEEALKLALEALGWTDEWRPQGLREEAIAAIKEALAQPEQEPDYYGLTADHLWMSISKDHYDRLNPEYRMTCYTTPPQRKPLTDEEIFSCENSVPDETVTDRDWCIYFARAIEAKLKEKNNA